MTNHTTHVDPQVAIVAAMRDPSRNLLGAHGPRCLHCSGLGRTLRMPAGDFVTKSTSQCSCKGSGLDQDALWLSERAALYQRIDALERTLLDKQRRRLEITSRTRRPQGKMSRQFWSELISWSTADGTPVANTTTEAIIMPNLTIPANYMQDGRRLRMRFFGKLSTTSTPTMTWAFRWGGVGGTLLATTEAITMGSGVANVNWEGDLTLQTRSNGATGTLLATGRLMVHTAAGTVLTNLFSVSGYDAPAAVTVDLTADTALAFTADWSAASSSNTLTGMDYGVESLN